MEWLRRVDRAGGGLGVDIALYGLSAFFAAITAVSSRFAPHRAWGSIAAVAYAVATVAAIGQLLTARGTSARARMLLASVTFAAVGLLPLLVQGLQRVGGRADRAQEEVMVIEDGGRRLVQTGSPYLSRAAIAVLPDPDRLLGYLPYQPGMAIFGVPRALAGAAWWTDARMWFALATIAALVGALVILRRAGVAGSPLVRAWQVATVLPICALTLATGGDDLPVLSLCLLALALAATGRFGGAGLAIGAGAALKLFAWPVAVVLLAYAITQHRATRYAAGALAVPVLTAVPALLLDAGAVYENVFAFPFGRGLVTSPAASPLPGHLLAETGIVGRGIVTGLLAVTAVVVGVLLVRRPPRSAGSGATIAGVGLLVAMLLLPSTRFGYLLYPVALLVWAGALRPVPERTVGTDEYSEAGHTLTGRPVRA